MNIVNGRYCIPEVKPGEFIMDTITGRTTADRTEIKYSPLELTLKYL